MNNYSKLFSSIITSTIWREPDATRILWVTLLALADKHGDVEGSIPGLAHLAGISIEDCEKGLDSLKSPDPYSRTADHDGRRIEEIPGGWSLLNYTKYRELASEADRREKAAARNRRMRERKKGNRDASVTHRDACVTHRDATETPDADTQTQTQTQTVLLSKDNKRGDSEESPQLIPEEESQQSSKPKKKPSKAKGTLDELKAYAVKRGLPESDGQTMFDTWESNGWKRGANPIKDWKAAFRSWQGSGYLPSQKTKTSNGTSRHQQSGRVNRNIGTLNDPSEFRDIV